MAVNNIVESYRMLQLTEPNSVEKPCTNLLPLYILLVIANQLIFFDHKKIKKANQTHFKDSLISSREKIKNCRYTKYLHVKIKLGRQDSYSQTAKAEARKTTKYT